MAGGLQGYGTTGARLVVNGGPIRSAIRCSVLGMLKSNTISTRKEKGSV